LKICYKRRTTQVGINQSVKGVKTNLGVLVFFSVLSLSQSISAQSPPSAPLDNNSILLTVEGIVETAGNGSAVWATAQTNQILHAGDQLRTGPRSRATVRLSNLTVLRVNELTTLEIQPPSAPGKQSVLNLKKGRGLLLQPRAPHRDGIPHAACLRRDSRHGIQPGRRG
jgi:hypothetical protein